MAKGTDRKSRTMYDLGREKTVKIDGSFLKREAKEAIKSYFQPFSGLYAAASGKKVIMVHDRDGRITSRKEPEKKRA